MYTQMFIAAVVIIAKTCKQPTCPLLNEVISLVHLDNGMEYYSVLKKNELSDHEMTWENLKCI